MLPRGLESIKYLPKQKAVPPLEHDKAALFKDVNEKHASYYKRKKNTFVEG